ncbi:potassium voltage-gated channel subfamily protein [Vibrio mimicus]|uniref:potassium channel family protein n=1 Tax=Vibrio mimicus TaxID=674 RepID=UPI0002B9F0DE|nr:potassium channel family protein [Vibrio mimicus]EMB50561.1 potassium voltage-gated channel subfamily protein [Vibrio mimicus CAIM 602]MBY7673717.1 potassium channel family protein [Vibrio mimicus]MBY7725470.1 potassium channel family protein [Vibrio mimicus]TXY31440.1 potassium channel protein [Vibrio mimicus]SUQ22748.1 potassium voltage-gated channel subfamily protein [Vibrio mimicus]
MKQGIRKKLLEKVENTTETPMLVLSVIYVVVALLPDIAVLSPEDLEFLDGLLWIVWGIFATELLVKIFVSPKPLQYMVQNWPDVLIVAMPFLRPLRFLRILLVLPKAWRQTRSVLRQKTFSFIGLTSLSTVLLSAAFVYLVEKGTPSPINSYSDALWWAMSTITTVGYGDMYPVTGFGRGVAVFLMLTGITLFGLLTASVASFFVEDDTAKKDHVTINTLLERSEQLEMQLNQLVETQKPRRRFHLASYRQQLAERENQRKNQKPKAKRRRLSL